MLQLLYNEFGFFGSILLALIIFIGFIFWFSGMAGIAGQSKTNTTRNLRILLAVVFPPFSIGWLIYDMRRQHKIIKGNNKNL